MFLVPKVSIFAVKQLSNAHVNSVICWSIFYLGRWLSCNRWSKNEMQRLKTMKRFWRDQWLIRSPDGWGRWPRMVLDVLVLIVLLSLCVCVPWCVFFHKWKGHGGILWNLFRYQWERHGAARQGISEGFFFGICWEDGDERCRFLRYNGDICYSAIACPHSLILHNGASFSEDIWDVMRTWF